MRMETGPIQYCIRRLIGIAHNVSKVKFKAIRAFETNLWEDILNKTTSPIVKRGLGVCGWAMSDINVIQQIWEIIS